MKTEIKGWIALYTGEYANPKEPTFHWFPHKTDGANFVTVMEHIIEIEVPDDFDPRPLQIAAIDEQIKSARAEFTKRLTELQELKQRLLAIENTVDAA